MAGGNLPFGLAPSGSLTSYTPTLRERATDFVRRSLFSDDRAGQGRAEKVMDVASMTPFGFGLDAYDAGREAGMGNLGGAGVLGAMAMLPVPKTVKTLKGEIVEPPRTFYRGTVPGSTERIKTGAQEWDSYLFGADNQDAARLYGPSIETITAKPDANILYEGSAQWRKIVGQWRKNESMLQYADRAAKAARAAGYDAAWFKRQSDIGTPIFDPTKFDREAK